MSCRRVLTALLAAALGYVTAAVAAFVYLPWWQAGLLLAALQFALVLLARWWVRRTTARLLAGLGGTLPLDPEPLARAEADVHAVRPLPGGPGRRVEVELTLFPAGSTPGPAVEWDPAALVVWAAGDAGEAGTELTPTDLLVRSGDGWRQPVGPLAGPQRLQFTVAVPAGARSLDLCRVVPGGRSRLAELPLAPTALPRGSVS